MPRRPVSVVAGTVAIVSAVAIWLVDGYLTVAPGSTVIRSGDLPWFMALLAAGCALDVAVAARIWTMRASMRDVIYLCLRTLGAADGFIYPTLPLYAVATLMVNVGPRARPVIDPHEPHDFRPVSGGWFRLLTPIWWSQNLVGASQIGARRCAACGQPEDAPIHASADEDDAQWPLDADAAYPESGNASGAEWRG